MGTTNKLKADELELVTAIRNDSFEKNKYIKHLINDYQGFIHKVRSETGLDESILKDIYTDTVLLILQHIRNDTFRGESRLSTYFYKIFYFKTVDYIRQNAANRIEYTDELPEQGDETQNITQLMEARDEMALIVKLLDKMCSPCREIIMDWAYWGFKPDEIGERIGETDPVKYSKLKYNCIDKFKKLWNKKIAAMM